MNEDLFIIMYTSNTLETTIYLRHYLLRDLIQTLYCQKIRSYWT